LKGDFFTASSTLGAALCAGIREALVPICPTGRGSWRCDETYIKVKGRCSYLYRAVDSLGQTVDFYLSAKRRVSAAKIFLRKAIKNAGIPRVTASRCVANNFCKAVRN
jgi:transposase-like protein